jgi:hypothetical protein
MSCFHTPTFLQGKDLYVNTWPCIVPTPFREATFCGVLSCVFDNLGFAADALE